MQLDLLKEFRIFTKYLFNSEIKETNIICQKYIFLIIKIKNKRNEKTIFYFSYLWFINVWYSPSSIRYNSDFWTSCWSFPSFFWFLTSNTSNHLRLRLIGNEKTSTPLLSSEKTSAQLVASKRGWGEGGQDEEMDGGEMRTELLRWVLQRGTSIY